MSEWRVLRCEGGAVDLWEGVGAVDWWLDWGGAVMSERPTTFGLLLLLRCEGAFEW